MQWGHATSEQFLFTHTAVPRFQIFRVLVFRFSEFLVFRFSEFWFSDFPSLGFQIFRVLVFRFSEFLSEFALRFAEFLVFDECFAFWLT